MGRHAAPRRKPWGQLSEEEAARVAAATEHLRADRSAEPPAYRSLYERLSRPAPPPAEDEQAKP